MFEVNKPKQNPAVVIRTATGNELSNYEKNKLANIEENAQKNKIETISVNGVRQPIDTDHRDVNITLGDLAFKQIVTAKDLDSNEIFFIKCDLDTTTLSV